MTTPAPRPGAHAIDRPAIRPAFDAARQAGGERDETMRIASTSSTSPRGPADDQRAHPAYRLDFLDFAPRAAGLAAALVAVGAAPPPAERRARIELPVRLVVLSDGTPRFGVPARIAGRVVEAGLDTGSTGLRVMARALPAAGGPTGERVRYGYGSGTVLNGPDVAVPVAFGPEAGAGMGAGGAVHAQRVESLACMASRPRCPATRDADPATFGIQGDGLPGEGFAAILGVNLRASRQLGRQPNPFEATGARRWIVELPIPGDHASRGAAPGRVVLNPTDAEAAGYRTMRLDGDDDSLPACIEGGPIGRICGAATIDTGAPGLRVVRATGHAPVPAGTPATIAVGSGTAAVAWRVATERRGQGSHLTFERRADASSPRLFLGVAPYYAFSILYDSDARTIGFKPR